MNLTDTDQTPIARVFEYVKREAARYGVLPLSSEIVGLIPKKALEDAAEWFLQVENFDSSLILENRLAAVMSGKMAVGGIARRSRAVRRTTGGADGGARRRQRVGRSGAMAAALGRHGRRHVARQEGLPAIRTRIERRHRAPGRATRAVQGRHRRRCRVVQRGDGCFQEGERTSRCTGARSRPRPRRQR